MKIEKSYRLETGQTDRVVIYLVGCGGTGSFLALHLARLAYHVRETRGLSVTLHFIDHDVVEPRNIGRQNFCPAEIGMNKARTLAQRFGRAFGLAIRVHERPVDDAILPAPRWGQWTNRLPLMIGAVDNAKARRAIQAIVTSHLGRVWWLDCGNHESSGQVLLGNTATMTPVISPLGFCAALPMPTLQHPELLEPEPVVEVQAESCADLTLRDAQSLMVNQAAAGWAAQYVSRLIISRDLDTMATYFDLNRGSSRSVPITKAEQEEVAA